MTSPEHDLQNLASAAFGIACAVDESDSHGPIPVDSEFGRALVHVDEKGADVELPNYPCTVHVRWDDL